MVTNSLERGGGVRARAHACVALGRCVAFGRPKMSVWGHRRGPPALTTDESSQQRRKPKGDVIFRSISRHHRDTALFQRGSRGGHSRSGTNSSRTDVLVHRATRQQRQSVFRVVVASPVPFKSIELTPALSLLSQTVEHLKVNSRSAVLCSSSWRTSRPQPRRRRMRRNRSRAQASNMSRRRK